MRLDWVSLIYPQVAIILDWDNLIYPQVTVILFYAVTDQKQSPSNSR